MKAKSSTSMQRGGSVSFTNALPPVMTPVAIPSSDTAPFDSLNWKSGLQGWSYFKESYIDIGGVTTTQEETAFITTADVQQPFSMQAYSAGNTPYGSAIYEYYFILDRKMTEEQFYDSIGINAAGNLSGVGFLDSEIDQGSVILGFQRTYQPRTSTYAAATSLELLDVSVNNFGYATSTAAARLYCYHIAWSYTAGFAGTIAIPDCRFVVNYVTEKEEDLVYLERLRRSYVQQGG